MASSPLLHPADLGPSQFRELVERCAPADQVKLLRARFERDLPSFCRSMWPDRFDLPFNALHDSLFRLQRIPPWTQRGEDVRNAIAAPRGFAKSTLVSFAELAHDVVFDREAYIVLLSAEQRLSLAMSRDLREQFRLSDSPLAKLFGPFQVKGGVKEWEVSVRGRPPVGVLARSFGTAIRGARHPTRGLRPTKVVIDDGEDKVRVRNPEQRAHQWAALTKDVLKLGRRDGGLLVTVVGTIWLQHAMLARLMDDPGWRAERWKAVIRWPKRADLWERARATWSDLTLGKHRRAAALAFYQSQKRSMDEGAELLDPAARDLFALYEQIWAEGWGSFLSEMQNEPVDPTTQVFFSERFARCRIVGDEVEILGPRPRRVKIRDLRLFGAWDPAVGHPHGDYASIVVVGRDEFGYCIVLEAWMGRVAPSQQLEAAWALAERYGLRRMRVESNGFQVLVSEGLERSRQERIREGRFAGLQIEPEPSTTDKDLRIASMEPDVSAGVLVFSDRVPAEMFAQFDTFPNADHDDGPDAVHAAWKGSGGSAIVMETRPAGVR